MSILNKLGRQINRQPKFGLRKVSNNSEYLGTGKANKFYGMVLTHG